MEEDIRVLLDNEVSARIKELSNVALGSKEETAAVESLAVLYRLRIEETKNEWDADEKYNRRVMEDEANARDDEIKRIQIKEQVKDRYFRIGIAAAELVIPLMFYGIWMNRGFQFEETGSFTSTTFRGLFNRFRPTKK